MQTNLKPKNQNLKPLTPKNQNHQMPRYFCFCSGDILLTTDGQIPSGDVPPITVKPWQKVTCLEDGRIEVIRLDSPVTNIEGLQMMGLRKTHPLLSPEDYALAGKAAELIYWDSNTRYCGVCGAPLKWDTPISKKCPSCGKEWWPSPAVAIIVRIRRGDEILLVHARNFRGPHYGLVAGFVELGETLEASVRREIAEEVGLRIENLRYFGSQPWPYPYGLMVGFTADYLDGNIKLQSSELTDGQWFDRQHLPQLPDKASIARQLIDDFLNA